MTTEILLIQNPKSKIQNARGQALLELAIFGSLLILLLGALVNYGLNADSTQQSMMASFRKALSLAPGPGRASVTVVRDKHFPNPAHPFAMGSVFPVSASSSVTRDFAMHETADNESELPKLTLDINGTIKQYAIAGSDDICGGEILNLDLLQAECRKDSSPWCCSKLDQLFAGIRGMGLQPGQTRQSKLTATLNKTENSSSVTTTSVVGWQEQVKRTVVTRPLGDTSGAVKRETITTAPKDEQKRTTWTTPWD